MTFEPLRIVRVAKPMIMINFTKFHGLETKKYPNWLVMHLCNDNSRDLTQLIDVAFLLVYGALEGLCITRRSSSSMG